MQDYTLRYHFNHHPIYSRLFYFKRHKTQQIFIHSNGNRHSSKNFVVWKCKKLETLPNRKRACRILALSVTKTLKLGNIWSLHSILIITLIFNLQINCIITPVTGLGNGHLNLQYLTSRPRQKSCLSINHVARSPPFKRRQERIERWFGATKKRRLIEKAINRKRKCLEWSYLRSNDTYSTKKGTEKPQILSKLDDRSITRVIQNQNIPIQKWHINKRKYKPHDSLDRWAKNGTI